MKSNVIVAITAGLLFACGAQAQNANPRVTEAKQVYIGIQHNVQKLAEEMPEANYSFKPTPDIRAFGQIVAHVADTQARVCSAVMGEHKAVNAASKTSKADLVAALKDSSEICDQAYDSLTDKTASETIKVGPMQRSKLGVLQFNALHSNEEYGYMSVYLRLKGIVPPTTKGASR